MKPAACLLLVVYSWFALFESQVHGAFMTGADRGILVATQILGILLLFLSAVRDGRDADTPTTFLKQHLADILIVSAAFFGRLAIGVFARAASGFSAELLFRSAAVNLPFILPAVIYLASGAVAAAVTHTRKLEDGPEQPAFAGRVADVVSRHAIGIIITAGLIMNLAVFMISGQVVPYFMMTPMIRLGLSLVSFFLSWWAVSYVYDLSDIVFGRKGAVRMPISWKQEVRHLVFLLLVCSMSGVFIYFRNVYEARFIDAYRVSLVFFICSLFVLFKWRRVFTSPEKAAVMTAVTMLLVMHFNIPARLFPQQPHLFPVTLAVCVILMAAAYAMLGKMKEGFADILETGLLISVSLLIAFNAVTGIPRIVDKLGSETELVTYDQQTDFDPAKAPDVYYLILDEYGGPRNLEATIGFDNADFYAFLEERRFNISQNSNNTEHLGTTVLVPDLLNLGHVAVGMNEHQLEKMMIDPYLYRFFQEIGYNVEVLSYPSFLDTQGWSSVSTATADFENSAGYHVLENSLLFQIWHGWTHFREGDYGTQIIRAIDTFIGLAGKTGDQPRFFVAYYMMPHRPFVFDENGERADLNHLNDTTIPDYYFSYLKWTNGQLKRMIDAVLEKDPGAILIIQSDHGLRNCYPEGELPEDQEEVHRMYHYYNVLNCVYYKGQVFDIEGLSGINTLRAILNNEYGTDFEMIEYQPG